MKNIRLLAALCFALLWSSASLAQSAIATDNNSVSITAGNTYQLIQQINQARRSLTIQNNNANGDNCWINIDGTVNAGDTTATAKTINGAALTAAKASILLLPGGSYTRYYPYTPSGQLTGTCATTADSLYVDTQ